VLAYSLRAIVEGLLVDVLTRLGGAFQVRSAVRSFVEVKEKRD
jgi:hypothetical protein